MRKEGYPLKRTVFNPEFLFVVPHSSVSDKAELISLKHELTKSSQRLAESGREDRLQLSSEDSAQVEMPTSWHPKER
jgi:hypothetical protein